MKPDGRGRHGNCGRKKKEDPRNKNINIRMNASEKIRFDNACKVSGLSQADYLMSLVDKDLNK